MAKRMKYGGKTQPKTGMQGKFQKQSSPAGNLDGGIPGFKYAHGSKAPKGAPYGCDKTHTKKYQ